MAVMTILCCRRWSSYSTPVQWTLMKPSNLPCGHSQKVLPDQLQLPRAHLLMKSTSRVYSSNTTFSRMAPKRMAPKISGSFSASSPMHLA